MKWMKNSFFNNSNFCFSGLFLRKKHFVIKSFIIFCFCFFLVISPKPVLWKTH
ncbi:hypothetical protein LEP1GSC041_2997 [Leptospira noguchii str. 2006001870]|nr:hypothetical protein LEP1GSC041_2997 [Leptospira noguchii str. 2006001870]